jgi:3-oxosteroid 1-dehydrogenase
MPPGTDDGHVIRGRTLEQLATAIAERVERYRAHTGRLTLGDDVAANLSASIERFNRFAERGADEDFHRGERAVQQLFNGSSRTSRVARIQRCGRSPTPARTTPRS